MYFEEYLMAKKIDAQAFSKAEPDLFKAWKREYEQMHPNSFTVQKLNLINPIRRKYPLKQVPGQGPVSSGPANPVAVPSSKPGKPIMKPKPKIN